jgi:hypothetical protein
MGDILNVGIHMNEYRLPSGEIMGPELSPEELRYYVIEWLIHVSEESSTPSARVRAMELLGKLPEVALFDEAPAAPTEHRSSAEVEAELMETLTRLLPQLASNTNLQKESLMGPVS